MKSLTEYLIYNPINEMADSLSDFINKINNLLSQLLENWCLVKWCDLYPYSNISVRLRNHWATELIGIMIQITNTRIKSGRKDKAIKNILIKKWELNDPDVIYNFINKKFTKEGLFKYSKHISEVCSNNIDEICNILSQNEDDVYNYVEGEIG